MGRRKATQRLAQETGEPPSELEENEYIVKVVRPQGNSTFDIQFPKSAKVEKYDTEQIYNVQMPPKFRNTIFIVRGALVVIKLFDEMEKKSIGDISGIVGNRKEWQKMPYWPVEYREAEKKDMMPPMESDEDDDYEEDEDEE